MLPLISGVPHTHFWRTDIKCLFLVAFDCVCHILHVRCTEFADDLNFGLSYRGDTDVTENHFFARVPVVLVAWTLARLMRG